MRGNLKYHMLLLVLALYLIPGTLSLSGQEVKSRKTSFRISNMPAPEKIADTDSNAPGLQVLQPKIPAGFPYICQKEEINLIGKVTDESGISFVSVNSEMLSTNEDGIFSTKLKLEPGNNEFSIVAMDEHENLAEQVLVVEYRAPVRSLAEKISDESVYYALIIGIDRYQDPEISNLDNPIDDASKLHKTLVKNYRFEEENIDFLKNATRADIIQALDKLAHRISSNDNLLIFYAGHGWWDADANNGYWLPSDSHRMQKTNWFRNSTLVNYLKEINTRHTLLITDACFGGSIFKTRAAFGNREKAYEKLYELPSRKAMTSGTLTEVPDQSPFTRYLIDRLERNQETFLSSEQLFSSFRLAVINNSDAVPQFGEIEKVGDQGGDFIFLRKE